MKVIVTLDDKHVPEIEQIAAQCEAAGMKVMSQLEMLGQITGDVDPKLQAALREIPGVLSVEESKDVQL